MKKPIYRWTITHPKHGTAKATGPDKLAAVTAAAKKWRVPWTSIARECDFDKGELVEEAER